MLLPRKEKMLTWRSLLLGALILLPGAWVLQRVELVYGGPGLATAYLSPFGPLAVVLLGLLAACRGWLRLAKGEVLAVYLVLAIGLPLASTGWAHYLLPGLVTGFYSFADETGRYHPFLRHIPNWLVPGREGSLVVEGFFEGRKEGVPWGAWLVPLGAWSVLACAFAAAGWGLVGLLRRRWMEEEHLRFPLAELPLELLAGRSFFSTGALWAGAAVPVLLYGLNGLTHYFGAPGEIPQSFDLGEVLLEEPWKAMAPFTSRFVFYFSPLLVGLAYLMSVEVSFSTWFFFLATRLQLLVGHFLGRSEDQGVFIGLGGQWREWPNFFPHLQAQARGGLLCVGLLSLWAGRRALGQALRRERGATGALLGGGLVLVLWSWALGLGLGLALLYWGLVFLMLVGLMRLRLDGGLPVTGLYFLAANLLFFALGTGPGAFAPQQYVALAFLSALTYTGLAAVVLVYGEGEKMAGQSLGAILVVGLILGLAAGYATGLELVYAHGLFALDQHGAARAVARAGRYFHYLYAEAGTQSAGSDWERLGAVGFGFAVTGVLSFLRLFFLRFPFHPLGYVFGTGLGTLLWGSALMGWAAKWVVVRYGGAATYRGLRPFFLGMIWGELVMRLAWAGACLAGEPGNGFDWW
jgi:hypothetical protein